MYLAPMLIEKSAHMAKFDRKRKGELKLCLTLRFVGPDL